MKFLALLFLLSFNLQAQTSDRFPGFRPVLTPCPNPLTYDTTGVVIRGCPNSSRLLILLNGTNANCRFYQSVLWEFITRGYMVACPESRNTGDGTDGVKAFDEVLDLGFIFDYVLVTGHSQGGGGSVATAYYLQETYAGLEVDIMPVEPAFYMGYKFREYAPLLLGNKLVVYGVFDNVILPGTVLSGFQRFTEPKLMEPIYSGHTNPHGGWERLLPMFD